LSARAFLGHRRVSAFPRWRDTGSRGVRGVGSSRNRISREDIAIDARRPPPVKKIASKIDLVLQPREAEGRQCIALEGARPDISVGFAYAYPGRPRVLDLADARHDPPSTRRCCRSVRGAGRDPCADPSGSTLETGVTINADGKGRLDDAGASILRLARRAQKKTKNCAPPHKFLVLPHFLRDSVAPFAGKC